MANATYYDADLKLGPDGELYFVTKSGAVRPLLKKEIDPFQSKELDLFILAGQSNAAGAGGTAGSAPSVASGTAYQWTSAGGVEELPDATNDELSATVAPQFCNTYHAITGRKAAFILSATGGSAQVAAADSGVGNWDTTGSLRTNLVTSYESAKSAFEAEGYVVNPKGILWMQGEQDAVKILDATITKAQYKTALETMIAYFRTNIASDLPFYCVQTGVRTGTADTGGWQVRTGQADVMSADPKSRLIYYNTVAFPELGFMADTVHYNQDGLNDIGIVSASRILGYSNPAGKNTSGAPLVPVTADNQVIVVGDREYIQVSSDNATASNRTIVLTAPTRSGQMLILENPSSTNSVQLIDGSALSFGDGTVRLSADWIGGGGAGSTLTLVSNGRDWNEVCRSDN